MAGVLGVVAEACDLAGRWVGGLGGWMGGLGWENEWINQGMCAHGWKLCRGLS